MELNKISEIQKELEKSKSFKDFKKLYKDSFLCAGFFILSFSDSEKSQYHLDYFIKSEEKIAGFDLLSQNYKIEEQAVKSLMNPLKDVKLSLNDLKEIILKEISKNNLNGNISKIIAILQNINNENIWILTVLMENLNFFKIKIKDSNSEILDSKKENLLNFLNPKVHKFDNAKE